MAYRLSQLNVVVAGSGPPLVMIHGNPATHTLWQPLMEPLSRQRTLYALDLPGFGASPLPPSPRDLALDSLARIVLDWARAQGIERFDLIGHSFGGAVSATIADREPELVRSLALIVPLADQAPPAGRLATSSVGAIARPLWKMAPGPVRRWFAHHGVRASYGAAYNEERARQILGEVDRPQAIDSMTGVMRAVDYAEYRQTLRRINDRHRMPLLLLGAGRDRIIPHQHFERTRAIFSRARHHVFPEGGHVPMWQYPDDVLRLLDEFYRDVLEDK